MFSEIATKVFKKPERKMVNVCVVEEQHPNHWAQKNDCHLLYVHDGLFSNCEELCGKLGAAKVIAADQCEIL